MASPPDPGNLFLASNGEVGQSDIEKITLSLLTYGDRVWLPASFALSPLLSEEVREHTTRKIESFIEAGLVQLWTLEGERSGPEHLAHRVIAQSEQADLREAIDTVVLPAIPAVITDRPSKQIDTASRVIETRHELWHLGIAAQCSAPGIVLGGRLRPAVAKVQPLGFDNLRDRYARELFDTFEIRSLGALETKDIADLRKHITRYRSHFDDLINMEPTALNSEDEIVKRCRHEFREYLHLVDDVLRGKVGVGEVNTAYETGSLFLEVAGYAIPMAGLLPLSMKFYHWLKDRHKYRFAFYLHRIKTVAEDRAARGVAAKHN
jgi:hypothetical protein